MSKQASSQSSWRQLFHEARHLIDQVNADHGNVIESWALGGGTALMLQIEHRESHDIDIFLSDPQLLAFLNPETHHFDFYVGHPEYRGDGSRSVKLAFEGLGEIDFIIAADRTDSPTFDTAIDGVPTRLETVAEIVAKKIFYRGTNIQARDIFDIAAAGKAHEREISRALAQYPDQVSAALDKLDRLNPDFVNSTISDLMIGDEFSDIKTSAIKRARNLLGSTLQEARFGFP